MQSNHRDNLPNREYYGSEHEQADFASSPPAPPAHRYAGSASPYHASPSRNRSERHHSHQRRAPESSHRRTGSNSPYYGPVATDSEVPSPPPHAASAHYNRAGPSRSRGDAMGDSAHGGMAGMAYGMSDRNARDTGLETMRSTGQVPPPPSRLQYQSVPQHTLSPQPGARFQGYDNGYASSSPSRSLTNLQENPYADDPYQGYSSTRRNGDPNLGIVDPNDIEDDGDDGLGYPRTSQRNSILSSSNSERGAKSAAGAAVAVGAAAGAGGAMGGLLRNARGGDGSREFYGSNTPEKSSDWLAKKQGNGKKKRRIIIIVVLVIVVAAIVGGIVGGLVVDSKDHHKDEDKSGKGGNSNADDKELLTINSPEIQKLLGNSDLHKVFPGMDYTPLKTQYPACLHDPPSQNNITRDMAVLSQLTNEVRLYGTDCNQTEMVLAAISQLEMTSDIKVWLGVWQGNNDTTNKRQLDQLYTVLDDYGGDPFKGIIVGNEVLYREDMSVSSLGDVLAEVRSKLSDNSIDLKVGTSDLGDKITADLAKVSDFIMANIHPFFAGVTAAEAADWTYSFWQNHDSDYFKSDDADNIIAETGWPTSGGTNCGGADTCAEGSVAGIDELNLFMSDWVCQALANGTNYFWFEAFDEPWKEIYNTKGKEWETEWGLLDVNRNLKDGVKIPDCGGKTPS